MKNILTLLLILPSCITLYAAQLSIVALPSPGQGIQAYRVMLDTEGQSLNAISGTISFPSTIFDLRAFDTTSSAVSLWVTQPQVSKEKSFNLRTQIVFEGIMPGGFTGVRSPLYEGEQPGKVFDFMLLPKGTGEAILTVDSGTLLANDGKATPTRVTKEDLSVTVSGAIKPSADSVQPRRIHDGTFAAFITQQNEIAQGAWYVLVSSETNLKSRKLLSVAESLSADPDSLRSYEWKEINGPYVLLHQARNRFVHVRADYYDNTYEVVTLSPVENSTRNTIESCILILSIIILIFSIIRPYYVTRFTKKKV